MNGNEAETNVLDNETPPVNEAELDAGFDDEADGKNTAPAPAPEPTPAPSVAPGEGGDPGQGGDPDAGEPGEGGVPGQGGEPAGEGPDLDAYLEEKRRKERDVELDRLLEEKRGGGGPPAETPTASAEPGAQAGPEAETGYNLADRLEVLKKDPVLSKLKFKVTEDGEPLTFEQMHGEYGALTELSIALAEAISRDNARAEASRLIKPVHETLSEREAEAATETLFQNLAGEEFGHTDARKIARSEQFWGWVDKQKPAVQALTSSLDPVDVDMVLKRYKSESGIEMPAGGDNGVGAGARDAARNAAQRERDLHGGTTHARRRRVATGSPGDLTERDLDAAFDEEAEKK